MRDPSHRLQRAPYWSEMHHNPHKRARAHHPARLTDCTPKNSTPFFCAGCKISRNRVIVGFRPRRWRGAPKKMLQAQYMPHLWPPTTYFERIFKNTYYVAIYRLATSFFYVIICRNDNEHSDIWIWYLRGKNIPTQHNFGLLLALYWWFWYLSRIFFFYQCLYIISN